LSTALIQQEKDREFASTNAERVGVPGFVDLAFKRPLKWDFKLDPSFMGIDSENKMIGIRSIVIPKKNFGFVFKIEFCKRHFLNNVLVNESAYAEQSINVEVGPEDDIERICSTIEMTINSSISDYNKALGFVWDSNDYMWEIDGGQAGFVMVDETQGNGLELLNCLVAIKCSSSDNTVTFTTYSFSPIPALDAGHKFQYVMAIGQPMAPYNNPDDPNEVRNTENERRYKIFMENQFRRVFNQPLVDNVFRRENTSIVLNNVWNRRDLFVHASFSSFPHNLIGHNDEFYTKPSKLYKYDSRSPDMQIWCSLDGKKPVIMYDQDVVVEVELISNVKYPNQY
jgi:hypothetical protein